MQTRFNAAFSSPLLVSLALLSACGGGGGGDAGAQPATVTTATAGTVRYSQSLLVTVNGSNLDSGLTLTSTACSNFVRSTTAPNVSTATTAYYTCTASGVGTDLRVRVTRTSDDVQLTTVPFSVALPQVRLNVTSGPGLATVLDITLSPQETPITVNNFLAYVNAGFYNNTVFHRHVPGFVLQGGGYAAPVNTTPPLPVLKGGLRAAITLEDNPNPVQPNLQFRVAMARTTVPDSATSQFFINLADNPGLNRRGSADADRGYAVFGKVSDDTQANVAILTNAPCNAAAAFLVNDPNACLPVPNLVITSAVQTQ